MKIVLADAYTANPGDLSWSELEKLGECEFHDADEQGGDE